MKIEFVTAGSVFRRTLFTVYWSLQGLPENLKSGATFSVFAAYFNLGINHEATFAQTIAGDSAVEQSINIMGARAMEAYACAQKDLPQSTKDLVANLCSTVG